MNFHLMSKDPAFLFYPGDYLRDTQNLGEKTQVAYDRIMCEHMRNICISEKQLKFFTKCLNEDQIEELLMMLTKVSGGYQIEWVAESIEKRRKYSESRRKNRTSKTKKICKTYDLHMENEIENKNKDIIKDKNVFSFFYRNKKYTMSLARKNAFDKFWSAFNDKRGIAGAMYSWVKIPDLTNTLVNDICKGAKAYNKERSNIQVKGLNPMMAQGWLSNQRWTDENYQNSQSLNQETICKICKKPPKNGFLMDRICDNCREKEGL